MSAGRLRGRNSERITDAGIVTRKSGQSRNGQDGAKAAERKGEKMSKNRCPKCNTTSKKFHKDGMWMSCDACGYSHYPSNRERRESKGGANGKAKD